LEQQKIARETAEKAKRKQECKTLLCRKTILDKIVYARELYFINKNKRFPGEGRTKSFAIARSKREEGRKS